MYAIFKKAFSFRMPSADMAKANIPGVVRHKRINPSANPIQVEPWITETDLYKLAVGDGSIVEVRQSAKAVAKSVAPDPEPEPRADENNGLAGSDDGEDDEKHPNGGKKRAKGK